MKIYSLVSRTLSFNSSYATDAVKALVVPRSCLTDYVVNPPTGPHRQYRTVELGQVLQPMDVLIGYEFPGDRDIHAVGLYHPEKVSEEPLVVSGSMIALRPHFVEEGLLLLACLLPHVNRRTSWVVVKNMDVTEIPGMDLATFGDFVFHTHQLREKHREVGRNLEKLVPSVAYHLGKKSLKEYFSGYDLRPAGVDNDSAVS